MKAQWLIVAAVALLAAGAGYLLARSLEAPAGDAAPSPVAAPSMDDVIGQRRPDFVLADADGRPVPVGRFDGQVLLLNFWASWCAPCVEEMPMLSALQADFAGRGVAVVGVALDQPERARAFADTLGLGYTLLFGEADAVLAGRRYGNASGMLPFTVLVGADGVVRWAHLGVVTRPELERQLAPLLPADSQKFYK